MSVGGELHRILESGDYWTCLAQGRDLLEHEPLSDAERARVLSVLCRCHLALGQLLGAAASGRRAASLARRLGLRDLEGAALIDEATALTRLHRHEEALTALKRFRQGLPEYTASQVLEGKSLQQTAEALVGERRTAEAIDWFERARHWFGRFGDEASAGDCLLGIVEACLAAASDDDGAERGRWRAEAARWLGEVEQAGYVRPDEPDFAGRYLLARARLYRVAGEYQASVDEAFRALLLAEELSPLQVAAQLHLSRMAEAMGRPVEALSFAFAARVSAIDGRLYAREFEAASLLGRLIRRYGLEPLDELAGELERQGVSLCQYLDPAEVERMARWE